MKVAVLEVGHWHAPLARVGLERAGVEVIAVSARDRAACAPWAQAFGARIYADAGALLAAEDPDFVFVFDRHRDLPATAAMVLERGISCSIEKPGGLTRPTSQRWSRCATGAASSPRSPSSIAWAPSRWTCARGSPPRGSTHRSTSPSPTSPARRGATRPWAARGCSTPTSPAAAA
jgi:hypothetical protein